METEWYMLHGTLAFVCTISNLITLIYVMRLWKELVGETKELMKREA